MSKTIYDHIDDTITAAVKSSRSAAKLDGGVSVEELVKRFEDKTDRLKSRVRAEIHKAGKKDQSCVNPALLKGSR